ncbi:MAG TPA: VTT domain-containing protein [Polyangia bacterium]|nr:VTT domain-containing protein [Polyangia bacterium]
MITENTEARAATADHGGPWRALVYALALLGIALGVWRFTPARAWIEPHRLAELGRALREHPAAPAIVLLVYVAAALTLFPITWLIAATALVFEPVHAAVLAFVGVLCAAFVTFWGGQVVARHRPSWLEGPRLARVRGRLAKRGVLTMAFIRVLPVGNFSLTNMAASALGLPFRDYMLGNGLGLLPAILLFTVLSGVARYFGWGAS